MTHNRPLAWYPFPASDLKELRQAVREDGIHAPWTKSILQSLNHALITPQDWRDICRSSLPSSLFLQWEALYRDECLQQARKNNSQNQGQNTPPITWTYDALFGQGDFATGVQQAPLPAGYFDQVRLCALQAWDRMTSPSTSEEGGLSLLHLRQGPEEALTDFILRTRASLERKISDPAARGLLLNTIIWEGMTPEHRQACQGLKNEHFDKWIVATQDIGTHSHKAAAIAQAFVTTILSKGKCFKCGETGHWKNECSKSSSKKGSTLPQTVCPRCRKGYHWKKDCRSKYDKDGRPIEPLNSLWGTPQPRQ